MDDAPAAGMRSNLTPPSSQPITMDDWRKTYWFSPVQMVNVVNPKPEAWNFMVEMRHFTVPAGGHERFPGPIANVYLDQMSKILAQDDDRLGYMSDPNLMKIYYDQLIVDVESLIKEATQLPAYLQTPTAGRLATSSAERAPWDSGLGERATDIAPNAAPVLPPFPDAKQIVSPLAETKPEARQFEQDGSKYKLVVGVDGRKLHYKDSKLTTAAEFNRAASLL